MYLNATAARLCGYIACGFSVRLVKMRVFYIIGVSQRVRCCSGLVSGSFAIVSTVV